MALTLIWEDGSGVPNANSYAQVADGDDYFDCSVYSMPWSIRSADFKAQALIMASRPRGVSVQWVARKREPGLAVAASQLP